MSFRASSTASSRASTASSSYELHHQKPEFLADPCRHRIVLARPGQLPAFDPHRDRCPRLAGVAPRVAEPQEGQGTGCGLGVPGFLDLRHRREFVDGLVGVSGPYERHAEPVAVADGLGAGQIRLARGQAQSAGRLVQPAEVVADLGAQGSQRGGHGPGSVGNGQVERGVDRGQRLLEPAAPSQ